VKETLPFTLLLVSLLCLVFVSCNDVSVGSSYSNPSANSGPLPPAGAVLSACGATISSPGTYSLNFTLATSADGEPCISIANVGNVTLNCNGNSITGVGEYGIGAMNVKNLIIENCNVATGKQNEISTFLSLSNVNGATVTGSIFGSNQNSLGGVLISDSTDVTFGSQLAKAPQNLSITATSNPSIISQLSNAPPPSNTLYGFIDAYNNVNLTIEGNAITSNAKIILNPFMIGVGGSQNTHVINNTVNGFGNPTSRLQAGDYLTGTDDDILIEDEAGPGALFSGNILVNTFDCGIETVGFMKNATMSYNVVDTVFVGIGGWYYLNVSNTQYIQNALTNIEYSGFYYLRDGPLRPAGVQDLPYFFYTFPADMPAETTINFTQNQFTGNTLHQPYLFDGKRVGGSVSIPVYSGMAYQASGLPGTEPTLQQFITVNNTFTNNTFDRAFGPLALNWGPPWTYTSDDIIDGGGNICLDAPTLAPSVSPTFGDPTAPLVMVTPINCGSEK